MTKKGWPLGLFHLLEWPFGWRNPLEHADSLNALSGRLAGWCGWNWTYCNKNHYPIWSHSSRKGLLLGGGLACITHSVSPYDVDEMEVDAGQYSLATFIQSIGLKAS